MSASICTGKPFTGWAKSRRKDNSCAEKWRETEGKLTSFDEHLNLVLEDVEDITQNQDFRKIGNLILRGDNVLLIYLES